MRLFHYVNYIFPSILAAISMQSAVYAGSLEWKGRVVDAEGKALPYVNVVALSRVDSTMVGGTLTAEDGSFSLDDCPDNTDALLMFSLLGYETVCLDAPADTCKVCLPISSETIEGSSVSAGRPMVSLSSAGLLTNVSGSVLENSGTLVDVLARVPGVIRKGDAVRVVGKAEPVIYVNGHKALSDEEWRNILSNEISSIEVITSPGPEYGSDVNSVIRVKTVKHLREGLGIDVRIKDDQSLRYAGNNDPSASIRVDGRMGRLELFAGVDYANSHFVQNNNVIQETPGSSGFRQEGIVDYSYFHRDWKVDGGFSFHPSENHSFGARVQYSVTPEANGTQEAVTDLFKGGMLEDHVISSGIEGVDYHPDSFRANVYYSGAVGKLGISLDLDYFGKKTSQTGHTGEKGTLCDEVINTLSRSQGRVYATKLELSYPAGPGTIHVGNENSFSLRTNRYEIDSDLIPSSSAEIRENNVGLYAKYGFSLDRVGEFDAGVRYERVGCRYGTPDGGERDGRVSGNLFPSITYAGNIGPVGLQMGYSAKTQRPAYAQINDAVWYYSRYVLQGGNAGLRPQINHNLDLTATWNFLTFMASYSRQKDAIADWSRPYGQEGVVLLYPVNLDSPYDALGFLLNAYHSVGIWTLNYSAGVTTQWLTVDCPAEDASKGTLAVPFSGKPVWSARLFNTFNVKGGWQFEIGGEFYSRGYEMNMEELAEYVDISCAVQKSFLRDGSLVLRLEGRDIAGTVRADVLSNYGSHTMRIGKICDTQRIALSIIFNVNTFRSAYKGTGAGADAVERM